MKRSKEEILKQLYDKGLIDSNLKRELPMLFEDYILSIADDEIKLLEEITRISEKIENNGKLTYLEESFYNFFLKQYKTT
jgi:hypothetical protein